MSTSFDSGVGALKKLSCDNAFPRRNLFRWMKWGEEIGH